MLGSGRLTIDEAKVIAPNLGKNETRVVEFLVIAASILLALASAAAGAYYAYRHPRFRSPTPHIPPSSLKSPPKLLRWSVTSLVTLPILLVVEVVLGFPGIVVAVTIVGLGCSVVQVIFAVILSRRASNSGAR